MATRRALDARRACDRCYAVKAKCSPAGNDICERCLRLGHKCLLTRPAQPIGRPALRLSSVETRPKRQLQRRPPRNLSKCKPISGDVSPASEREGTAAAIIPEAPLMLWAPSLVDHLTDVERTLLHYCLDSDRVLNQFLIAPSFASTMKAALASRFATIMPLVKDGYAACAGSFAEDQALSFTGLSRDMIHWQAATAIKILRSMTATDSMNVTNLLSVGLAIYTFAQFGYGQDVFTVCRYILSLVKPMYGTGLSGLDTDSHSFLATIVGSETFECLWRCEIPTLRFPEHHSDNVDRYLGVSIPLLCVLQDLCELGMAMKYADDTDRGEVLKSLYRIKQKLEHWKPKYSSAVLERFSASEAACILTQHEVFRLVGLLVSHRLRYPYGCNDKEAVRLSRAIIREISITRDFSGRSVKQCAYPYVFACMEITDENERLQAVKTVSHLIGYTAIFRSKIQIMMRTFWRVKDQPGLNYWYEYSKRIVI